MELKSSNIKAIDFLNSNKRDFVVLYILKVISSDPLYSDEGASFGEIADLCYTVINDYFCFNENSPLITKFKEKAFFMPHPDMIIREKRLDADIKYATHFVTGLIKTKEGAEKRTMDSSKVSNLGFLSLIIISPDERLERTGFSDNVYYYKKTIEKKHGIATFKVVCDKTHRISYVNIMPNKSPSWLDTKKKSGEYYSSPPLYSQLDSISDESDDLNPSTPLDSESHTLNPSATTNIQTKNDMNDNSDEIILAEGGTIAEQVEEKLQLQQKNKEFKDVGRVAQTKKERSAYKLISANILSDLEQDGVMAYNMVKKENVWPEIDTEQEKERGVSAGAAYLKVKIREAAPTRPKDDKGKRATYVLFLEVLQKDLSTCLTVSDIITLRDNYRKLPMDQVIGYFINPEFLTSDQTKKEQITAQLKTNKHLSLAFIYGSNYLVSKLINEVFGARFDNTLFNKSDAAGAIWAEAKSKEPITEEESSLLITKLHDRRDKFIEANKELIEKYKNKTIPELKSAMETDWSLHSDSKKRYKANIEEFRQWAISYYERRIRNENAVWERKEKESQPKNNDWSWTEKKENKSEIKPKNEAINTKAPLSYIKRTGGYKITTNTPQEIVDKFGFSAVNYGVYVDDTWSKEHTKHFLGAMCDLGQILNINIAQLNALGKLSIAFGAKGRKGHAAAYFPQTKDINLTRGNGDGSVAHEYGHYFDNVIVELSEKLATNKFASQGESQDMTIRLLYKELMDFFYKGNPLYTPKVPMNFYAQKSTSVPSYSVRNANGNWEPKTVQILETIEETLSELTQFSIVNKDIYSTQKRLFGYVIDAFGLDNYAVPMTLKTSYVYHKSAYGIFQYCYKTDKGIDIVVSPRTKYWSSAVELFARAWETVVLKKILLETRVSNYLVDDIPMEDIVSESYNRPYPSGKELDYIETIIDKIVIAVKSKFGIGDFVPPSDITEDEYLELDKKGKTDDGMVVVEESVIEVIESGEVVDIKKPEDSSEEDTINTLEMLIEAGGSKEEMAEWTEAVSTLKMLMPEPEPPKTTQPKRDGDINELMIGDKVTINRDGKKVNAIIKNRFEFPSGDFMYDLRRITGTGNEVLGAKGKLGTHESKDITKIDRKPGDVNYTINIKKSEPTTETSDYPKVIHKGDHKNFWYYVVAEKDGIYTIVSEDKIDLWKKASPLDRAEYYEDKERKENMEPWVDDGFRGIGEYRGQEIFFEPHFKEYFTNDEQFPTLQAAKDYIDKGSPLSAKTKNAYSKGAM